MRLKHICEVCGKEEILTPEEAYDLGWDYPPMFGSFGIISARTCPNCSITKTVWWKLIRDGEKIENLSKKDYSVVSRILDEPKSILVEE